LEIDWDIDIVGVRMLRVRDLFRRLRGCQFGISLVEDCLKVTPTDAAAIVAEFQRRGWVEQTEPACFKLTALGTQIAAASAATRIPRSKAEKILKAFLSRVNALNANDDYGVYVASVQAFGSYVDASKDYLGDINLEVAFCDRPIIGREWRSYADERQHLARRSGWFHDFSTYEAKTFLKARSPYLSLARGGTVETLGAKAIVLFQAPESEKAPRIHRGKAGRN